MLVAMKVKTAELKNHLSRYLRELRETGETIIVCDRDRPVAALSSLSAHAADDPEGNREAEALRRAFEKVGLTCSSPSAAEPGLADLEPSRATDGRKDVSTVDDMRGSRDW